MCRLDRVLDGVMAVVLVAAGVATTWLCVRYLTPDQQILYLLLQSQQ